MTCFVDTKNILLSTRQYLILNLCITMSRTERPVFFRGTVNPAAKGSTSKVTWPKGVKKDASTTQSNLPSVSYRKGFFWPISASCDLGLWRRDPQKWSFHVDEACQFASTLVCSFTKYRIHKFGNTRINERTDGQTDRGVKHNASACQSGLMEA